MGPVPPWRPARRLVNRSHQSSTWLGVEPKRAAGLRMASRREISLEPVDATRQPTPITQIGWPRTKTKLAAGSGRLLVVDEPALTSSRSGRVGRSPSTTARAARITSGTSWPAATRGPARSACCSRGCAEEDQHDAPGSCRRRSCGAAMTSRSRTGAVWPAVERREQDLVLAPETGERGIPASAAAPMSQVQNVTGIFLRRPPISCMSWVSTRVDHASPSQEEQGLEEGVRHQVEDGRRAAADAQGQHHVAQLADGGVGQHPLDVVLHQGDAWRQTGGDAADVGDWSGPRGRRNSGVSPGHQVDAGRHHGRRVDQGGDRRGTGHGVGQPDVQGELRRLAHGARKEQHRRGRQDGPADCPDAIASASRQTGRCRRGRRPA